MGIMRRIEREAARRGYCSDCTIEDAMLPDTGTWGQQMDIAAIWVDVHPGPLSTRDHELVNELIRKCVLSTPARRPINRISRTVSPVKFTEQTPTTDYAIARAWQRRGK